MNRYAGVLLSVTSLPSKYGIGCFDQAAYDFVDWLEKAGQRYWQILPLGATSHGASDDSPYQAYSAFAGNPYMISLDALIDEGVLTQGECDAIDFGTNPAKVDFDKLNDNRLKLLHKAYERSNIAQDADFRNFCSANAWWLDDYALFMSLKTFFGDMSFRDWPEDIRMHWGFAVDYYNRELYFDIEFQKYLQFKFDQQWSKLKAYANARHIQIVGDIPIYVSPEGSDVWAHPELFQLDENNVSTAIAGCPPDAFAADGQVWGNPLYRWDFHRATGFEWWVSRMWYSFKLYDVVRVDHFRGFDEYFSIPADSASAKEGHWEKGPGMDLFRTIHYRLGDVNIIAEDLGALDAGVYNLIRLTGFPGMNVWQFSADEMQAMTPEQCRNRIFYSGTHDNQTLAGWCAAAFPDEDAAARADEIIRALYESAAPWAIVQLQDMLSLGDEARLNVPGTPEGNWRWRVDAALLTDETAQRYRKLAEETKR